MPGRLIVVTVGDPLRADDPVLAARKTAMYAEALAGHGAVPMLLSPAAPATERHAAFDSMAGLLLSGGPDVDPARYGARPEGARDVDAARDEMEHEAWTAAERRGLPVLGICRGFQLMNVLSGGRLLQDVAGHRDTEHAFRLVPGSRLARILFPTNIRGGVLQVNSSHHQAVRPGDVAPALAVAATASSPAGEIVEALETRSGRFIVGVQCHPERPSPSSAAFERLFRFFVDAAGGAVLTR